jgi:hypothetical protein
LHRPSEPHTPEQQDCAPKRHWSPEPKQSHRLLWLQKPEQQSPDIVQVAPTCSQQLPAALHRPEQQDCGPKRHWSPVAKQSHWWFWLQKPEQQSPEPAQLLASGRQQVPATLQSPEQQDGAPKRHWSPVAKQSHWWLWLQKPEQQSPGPLQMLVRGRQQVPAALQSPEQQERAPKRH